ncbi:alpha/beta hydrolase [Streptomyces sp. WAC05374]|uniref:alpha/beta fold hydrolase n=1 Tax=Streptomyces sp. WAC05374 TaxID=2487420 RepID=UPI000F86D97C|nr:alpha/beta hydrolase [Streptomyces sp. WAC05374]RST19088.1 alpha/beta hydrolase [Streptomyces sp. WAC05374]TDF36944.1 alpha/beta hydrolase [Streptomyces sp. WAC05374]TDF46439.1 alpha/beta hydrolase [Streptomyces sp. WAC05374]TDF47540.1 alpha/beta hydrolase [Streptomyces sp. WAC05374]
MTAADAVPVVFVHGTRFSAGQWSVQLAALEDEFPVAAVDLPGHGERADEPWSLSAATDVIAGAVDALGRGPALVVGHSLGGYAALEFARRCPQRLRGLVLAGASASTRGPWAAPYRWVAGLVPRLPADRLARWNDRLLRRLYPPRVVEATIRGGYAFHTLPAAWGEVLGRFDASAMRHVGAPVLILNGEKDTVFRADERDFARAHPRARVELIPRARHLANFDAPDAFTDAVRRFARELAP